MEEGNKLIKSLMFKSFGLKDLSPQIVNRITEELLFDLSNVVYQANEVKDQTGCLMLMPSHVDIALKRRNFPPQYGFRCHQNKPFGLVSGGGCDLSFIEESVVDLKKFVSESTVLKEPPEMEIHTHWFAVDGVQTVTPENASLSNKELKMKGPRNKSNKSSAKQTWNTQPSFNINLNGNSNFSNKNDDEVFETAERQNSLSPNSCDSPDAFTDSDESLKSPSYKASSSSEDLEIQRPHRKGSGLGII